MLELKQFNKIANIIKNSWWMLDYTEFCERLNLEVDDKSSKEKWIQFQGVGSSFSQIDVNFLVEIINSNQDLAA